MKRMLFGLLFAAALVPAAFAQLDPGQVSVNGATTGVIWNDGETVVVRANPLPQELWCVTIAPRLQTGAPRTLCAPNGGEIAVKNTRNSYGLADFPAGTYDFIGYVPTIAHELRFNSNSTVVTVPTVETDSARLTNVEGKLRLLSTTPVNGAAMAEFAKPADAKFWTGQGDGSATVLQVLQRTNQVTRSVASNPAVGITLQPPPGARPGDTISVLASVPFNVGGGAAAFKWIFSDSYIVGTQVTAGGSGVVIPPGVAPCAGQFILPTQLPLLGLNRNFITNRIGTMFDIPAVEQDDGTHLVPAFDIQIAMPAGATIDGTGFLTIKYWDGPRTEIAITQADVREGRIVKNVHVRADPTNPSINQPSFFGFAAKLTGSAACAAIQVGDRQFRSLHFNN